MVADAILLMVMNVYHPVQGVHERDARSRDAITTMSTEAPNNADQTSETMHSVHSSRALA
jgi:hypothetical protein